MSAIETDPPLGKYAIRLVGFKDTLYMVKGVWDSLAQLQGFLNSSLQQGIVEVMPLTSPIDLKNGLKQLFVPWSAVRQIRIHYGG